MMRKRVLQALKKGCAVTLALSALLPVQSSYAAEENNKIIFVENFDGCVTNSTDASVSIAGDPNVRVLDEGNENKVLFLPNEDYNCIRIPFEKVDADNIVFSMKVKFANKAVPFKVTITNGSENFKPVSISENGVTAHDGKKIGGVAKDVWNQFDIVYNTKLKRYSVYINGSCKLYMYLYKQMSSINEMILEFEGEKESLVYLDDIAVYTGNSPDSSIRGEQYNPESTEFVETEASSNSSIFVNNNFNKSTSLFDGLNANSRGNIFEYAEESNGNGYLFFKRIADNMDTYFDAVFEADSKMKGLVLSADFSTKSNTPTARIFSGRNGDAWLHILSLTGTGEIRAANGALITPLKKNQWVNVALVLNFRRKTYDVYCDGQKIVERAAFPNSSFEKLTSVRTQMLPTVGTETLMIDNVKIYESDVPKEISEEAVVPEIDIFSNESSYLSYLKGSVALNLGSDWMFAKNAKKRMDAVPYVSNDRTMIPVRAVTEAFGLKVDWDENERLITLDGKTRMKVGEKAMTLNGKTVELDSAPEIKDGRTYIPVRALAEQALGKKVFFCDYGLIVISDKEFNYGNSDATLRRLSTYVFSERPDKDTIKQAFENSGYKNVHPRLHANADDFAKFREEYKTNNRIKEWTDNIIKLADGVLNQPPLGFTLDSNGRLLHTSRAVQDRLLNLGYAYQMTGDKKYAERAWKEMESACACPHWNPVHFLDTGEMAYAIAIGYDWCYDYLTEEQRSIIVEGITKLGLREGIKQYNGMPTGVNFVFQDMNWNAVCNGGLAAAALAIIDVQPDEAVYTINRALRSFEYMMTEFAPDGGWIEGPMYWGYMMKYFCLWMDCMNSVLGTDFNVPNYPGISKTGNAIFALQGNEGGHGFNDAGEGDVISPELMWLGKYFENDGLTSAYLSFMDLKKRKGTIYDCLYYDTSVSKDVINMPLDNVTRDVETGTMRSNWDGLDGTYLSYRGGKARVNHYHLSEGSFVFDALGVRWAMDIGADSIIYVPSFTADRNHLYRVRPEGHNVVVINPSKDPGQDMEALCPIIKSVSKPKGAYQVVDLFSAYKNYASDYLRGYMLTDDRQTAVIRDEFTLLNQSEAYWFMHTRADIQIVSDDTAILTRNGKRMQFKMICEGADAELKVMPAEPLPTTPSVEGQASNKGINKIAIYMRGNGKVSVSVRMTPADSYTAEEAFVCSEIASWSIPDGEVKEIPMAKKILVDGEELPGFDSRQPYYTIVVFSDNLPEISVDGGEYKTEYLSEAQDINGVTAVKISDDEGRYTTYRISYKTLPVLAPVGGRNRLSPVNIYASANARTDTMDYNAIDEDFDTVWGAEEVQTLTCDFGQTVTVDGFGVAVMNGLERQFIFEIQVSEDGKNFTTVYDGATAGGTNDYEMFSIEPVKARYVQYLGKKNTQNNWNSIAEFAVFGQRE